MRKVATAKIAGLGPALFARSEHITKILLRLEAGLKELMESYRSLHLADATSFPLPSLSVNKLEELWSKVKSISFDMKNMQLKLRTSNLLAFTEGA